MHSRRYLRAGHFRFVHGGDERPWADVFPEWSPHDRVVIVAPDPARDLVATAGLILALTHAFYDRPVARQPAFFDYPNHFVIGGEAGAEPRILRPQDNRWWSAAWCRLDVWPSTHHAIADPSPEHMLQAVFLLEPTRLLWPERLALPSRYESAAGPDEGAVRALLRSRLRQMIRYSRIGEHARPDAWTLELSGSSRDLVSEATDLLQKQIELPRHDSAPAAFRSIPVADFF